VRMNLEWRRQVNHTYQQSRIDSETYKQAYRHNAKINVPKIIAAKQRPCADCGLRWHPSVMTFDHLDRGDKFKDANQIAWFSSEDFDAEMAKGEWVCQNCHIVRELKRDRPFKDKFKEYYLNNLSLRGGILRHGVKDIDYHIRF
jgi:ABC-type taurine transport system substrate-binding protein